MLFEQSSGDPLVNCESNVFDQSGCSGLIAFHCLFYSFEEEFDKAFQRVLVHVVDDAEGNAQEI